MDSILYTPDVVDRFWSHVDRSGGPDACWPYQAAIDTQGYGAFQVKIGGKWRVVRGHRMAWSIENNQAIPKGGFICHLCDYRPCCNPRHLHLADHRWNMRDASLKGRMHPVLTANQVREVRRRIEDGETLRSIAADLSVSESAIYRIKTRQNWRHLTREVLGEPYIA